MCCCMGMNCRVGGDGGGGYVFAGGWGKLQ